MPSIIHSQCDTKTRTQKSLEELLDLSSLACKDDVLVQYAAVNKYGRSDWSVITRIDVYGGKKKDYLMCAQSNNKS